MEHFRNCRTLKKALLNSVDLLNSGDFESIRGLIDNALKAGNDKNIGHEYLKDTEARYREDARKVVPTPWEKFNEFMQVKVLYRIPLKLGRMIILKSR